MAVPLREAAFPRYGILYSLADCASFVTMEEMKIEAALAFDQHFIQAGFKKLP
jgi:predicted nucleic acid-binding protein